MTDERCKGCFPGSKMQKAFDKSGDKASGRCLLLQQKGCDLSWFISPASPIVLTTNINTK
jgi:hypothetical protein